MQNLYKFILLFLFVLIGITSYSQKIGFINSQQILEQLPEMKVVNTSMEEFNQELTEKSQKLMQAFETDIAAFNKIKHKLTEEEIKAETEKMYAKEKELAVFQETSQKQLLEKQNTLITPILEKLQHAINEIAQNDGYIYVLDTSQGGVVYADNAQDIQQKVLEKM